jgi:hypothetical protein
MSRLANLKASKNARVASRANSATAASQDPIVGELDALELTYNSLNDRYKQLQPIFDGLLNNENKKSGLNANNTIKNIKTIIIDNIKNKSVKEYTQLIQNKYQEILLSRQKIDNDYLIPLKNLSEEVYNFNMTIISKYNEIISTANKLKPNNPITIASDPKLTFYQRVIIPRITNLKANTQELYEDTREDLEQHTKVANNIIVAFKYEIKNYFVMYYVNIITQKVDEIKKNLADMNNSANKTNIEKLIAYKIEILRFLEIINFINTSIIAQTFLQNEYVIANNKQKSLNNKTKQISNIVSKTNTNIKAKINIIKAIISQKLDESSAKLQTNTQNLTQKITDCGDQINAKIAELTQNIDKNKDLMTYLDTLKNSNNFKNLSIKKNQYQVSKNTLLEKLKTDIKTFIDKLKIPTNNGAGNRIIAQKLGVNANAASQANAAAQAQAAANAQAKAAANEQEWKNFVKNKLLNRTLLTGKGSKSGKNDMVKEIQQYLSSHPNISSTLKNKITKYRKAERNAVY